MCWDTLRKTWLASLSSHYIIMMTLLLQRSAAIKVCNHILPSPTLSPHHFHLPLSLSFSPFLSFPFTLAPPHSPSFLPLAPSLPLSSLPLPLPPSPSHSPPLPLPPSTFLLPFLPPLFFPFSPWERRICDWLLQIPDPLWALRVATDKRNTDGWQTNWETISSGLHAFCCYVSPYPHLPLLQTSDQSLNVLKNCDNEMNLVIFFSQDSWLQ